MTAEPRTCEACGQPILVPLTLSMMNCQGCGKALRGEGGRYVKRNGICQPHCFPCAAIAESGPYALRSNDAAA
jgi:hypothetical protein